MLLTKNLLKYFTIFTIFQFCRTKLLDYFGENFDENENCKKKEKAAIKKLITEHRENNTGNCWKTAIKSPSISHLVCFSQLTNQIYKRCKSKQLIKALGKTLYCQKRGVMDCCYDHFECIDTNNGNYIPKQEKAVNSVLEEYTKYGFNILPDMWAFQHNFRICKKTTTPMDNRECTKACNEEEMGDFAIRCRENKNLFKCCIHKKSIKCDKCNICCILPVCSMNGTTPELREIKFNTNVTLTPEIDSSTKAAEIRKFMKNMTKTNEPNAEMQYFIKEHFCVKTADTFSLTAEHIYNMTEYRRASTKKEMKAVSTYAVNKNMQYQIPKTRKLYATKQGPYIWRELFNFDKCYNVHPLDNRAGLIKCYKKCEKLEQSRFAKQCNRKKNSVFKCCIVTHDIEIYENLQRKIMKKYKKSVKRYCSGGKCKTCCVLSICTTLNSHKKIVDKMVQNSPYTWRYDHCVAVTNNGTSYSLNMTQFKFAHTKDDLCNVEPNLPVKIRMNKSCKKKRRKEKKKKKSKRKRKHKNKRSKKHDSKESREKRGRYGRKKKSKEKSKKN